MNQKTKLILAMAFFMFLFEAQRMQAAVIFEDNFDSYTWNTDGSRDGDECNGTIGAANPCVSPHLAPGAWSFFRANQSGTTSPIAAVKSLPSAETDHTTRTVNGHAFIAKYGTAEYSGDSRIDKYVATEYPDIWMSLYVKFEPGYADGNFKFVRIQHLDAAGLSDNAFIGFPSGYLSPGGLFDLNANGSNPATATAGKRMAYRCDPQASAYYCTTADGVPNDDTDWHFSCTYPNSCSDPLVSTSWGDGNWHRLKFHIKMNSVLGANDGIFDVWYDETLISTEHDIRWRKSGADAVGWNVFALGGNTTGLPAEKWAAFDDVVIATTEAELDGGGSSDTIAPASPSGLSVR